MFAETPGLEPFDSFTLLDRITIPFFPKTVRLGH